MNDGSFLGTLASVAMAMTDIAIDVGEANWGMCRSNDHSRAVVKPEVVIWTAERPKPGLYPLSEPDGVRFVLANHAVEGTFGWSRMEQNASLASTCTSRIMKR